MASISISELRPGMRLAYDLRDAGGRLLLAARRPLTEVVIRALESRHVTDLPLRSADALPRGVRREDESRRSWLMAGARTKADAARAEGGDEESDEMVVTEREVREGARIRAAMRRSADGVIAHRSARWARLSRRVRVGAWEEEPSQNAVEAFGETRTLWSGERFELVARMFARLAAGEPTGAGIAHALAEEMTDAALRGPEMLLRSTIEGVGAELEVSLEQHAYATGCVSAAIAARVGWDREQVRAAALAGLLADCGLALMAWDVRGPNRPLTDVEQNALRRHPAYSAAMLEMLRPGSVEESIPEQVQLAAYQHHEREDGSGYPGRIRGEQIHDLARVTAVADVFVGLASARADRPAMAPTSALAEVARQANSGVLAIVPARAMAEALVGASMGAVISVRARGARMAA